MITFLNDLLNNVSSAELIALAGFFAVMISQGLSQNEIARLASFFSAIGDNLGIISSSPIPNNNLIN